MIQLILVLVTAFSALWAKPVDWEYQIVMIDGRQPDRPFVIMVSKANPYGIKTLEEMMKLGDSGYIGVPIGPVMRGPIEGPLHKWSYHIDPDRVEFGEATIELCDGSFDYVEDNLEQWLEEVGSYCPWNASNWVKEIWKGTEMLYERPSKN